MATQITPTPRKRAVDRLTSRKNLWNKVPSTMLHEAPGATLPYQPPVRVSAANSDVVEFGNGLDNLVGVGVLLPLGAVIGTIGALFIDVFVSGAKGTTAYGIFLGDSIVLASLGGLYLTVHGALFSYFRPKYRAMMGLNMGAFRTWLADRYGLQISDAQLWKIRGLVNGEKMPDQLPFVDTANRVMVLRKAHNNTYTIERGSNQLGIRQADTDSETGHVKLPLNNFEQLEHLSPNVRALYDQITQVFGQLHSQQLTAGQLHVIERAREDLADALTLNERLHEATQAHEERDQLMVETFTNLLNEVKAIARVEVDAAMAALRTHNLYVRDRGAEHEGMNLVKNATA